MEPKCFCGNPATHRNTVKDKRGLNYSMVHIYPTCDEHCDSTPPELWAPSARQFYEKELS